jgi:ornithine decarboxylase
MSFANAIWPTPSAYLKTETPDQPVLFFAPVALQDTARRFLRGFPGLVTYAVKANDGRMVLENLVEAGLRAFDVASPDEMRKVRAVLPGAALHYNNPVRSRSELAIAAEFGVASYSVDDLGELAKIADVIDPKGIEIAVRLKLPVKGAAYDFGAKFGARPEDCVTLLREVVALGFVPAMTFHPGTQCADPEAWAVYIRACARVAAEAGVTLKRLNVGGGFAAHRTGPAPDLEAIFGAIERSVADAFPTSRPALVCEPGRAMVAEAYSLGACVKALRADGSVFLNDGIYGGLAEAPIIGNVDRISVVSVTGLLKSDRSAARVVFGPTCDSLDRLPDVVALPRDLAEGDWVVFHGMGAYSTATLTRFNGYGDVRLATVSRVI